VVSFFLQVFSLRTPRGPPGLIGLLYDNAILSVLFSRSSCNWDGNRIISPLFRPNFLTSIDSSCHASTFSSGGPLDRLWLLFSEPIRSNVGIIGYDCPFFCLLDWGVTFLLYLFPARDSYSLQKFLFKVYCRNRPSLSPLPPRHSLGGYPRIFPPYAPHLFSMVNASSFDPFAVRVCRQTCRCRHLLLKVLLDEACPPSFPFLLLSQDFLSPACLRRRDELLFGVLGTFFFWFSPYLAFAVVRRGFGRIQAQISPRSWAGCPPFPRNAFLILLTIE